MNYFKIFLFKNNFEQKLLEEEERAYSSLDSNIFFVTILLQIHFKYKSKSIPDWLIPLSMWL